MARFGSYTNVKDGQLANSGVATLGVFNTETADRIRGTIFSDQAGSLTIEQSYDNANWDLVTTYAITASTGKGYSEEIVAPYVRVRFTNTGGSTTTAIRFYASFSSAGGRP